MQGRRAVNGRRKSGWSAVCAEHTKLGHTNSYSKSGLSMAFCGPTRSFSKIIDKISRGTPPSVHNSFTRSTGTHPKPPHPVSLISSLYTTSRNPHLSPGGPPPRITPRLMHPAFVITPLTSRRFRTVPKCGMSNPVATPSATPSWSKLSALTIHQDYANGPNCASPTKELTSRRLFGQSEADIRLVVYRDHAGWCPYCHKVQLMLEAKRIPYIIKKVNMSCYGKKSEEFLAKVPTGLMPVVELDGKLITESMDIMFLIEENFQISHRQMIPTDDNDMMQAFHRYIRLERVFTGAWLGALRGPMSMVDRGLEPVHQALDMVEQGLGEFVGPFFYPGDKPTMIDINFSTIFERARSSLKYWRNLEVTEGRPNLKKWFEHWYKWPPARYLRSDDWTHIGALPPQIGPVKFTKNRNPASLAVETARAQYILNDGPERKMERNIAAATMCRNSALVVKDAIRGGKVPEEDHGHVDNAFRIMAQVLFDTDQLEVLEERARAEIPKRSWKIVGNAVRFERARCCSPRDMPAAAMEQFCGAINWFLRTIEQELV